MREAFEKLSSDLLKNTSPPEYWTFELSAEETQFLRLTEAQIRQTGTVSDIAGTLTLVLDLPEGRKTACRSVTLSSNFEENLAELRNQMSELRQETSTLPFDPYATLPIADQQSSIVQRGELPRPQNTVELLREPLTTPTPVDLAGSFASGTVIRAHASNRGTSHWYETDSFFFDYSLYTPAQKAVKNLYAGQDWSSSDYRRLVTADRKLLERLEIPPRAVPRGDYRVYLGPQAVHEILQHLSYDVLSEASIRQQESPFRLLRSGEKQLSSLFNLSEDFSIGLAPRFNDDGSLAPEKFPLISAGKLVNTLISARTGAEYQLTPNGADDSESLRSPVIHPGTQATGALQSHEILKRLGTGLYLSNLHYLNWSDSFTGRITGMTRNACFWVENGEVQVPIQDLRFDESIFDIFGAALEALSEESWLIPSTSTYESRSLGGGRVPGMLLKNMKFTL